MAEQKKSTTKRSAEQITADIKRTAKSKVRKSVKKHPGVWVLIILVIAITIFIITPTENPVKVTLVFDSVAEELAIPAIKDSDFVIQHTGFTLSYNEEHEQPNWVAYLLTADEAFATTAPRNDNFHEDPAIPTGSATLADYRNSGYDRGHLIPAADQKWSAEAMDDSFYMSNMSPQTHAFNGGIWNSLENAVRTMAVQNQEILVVTGPVLTDGPYKTIGDNKVSVPNYYYKVILDYYGNEKKAIGFIMAQDAKGDISTYAVTVDDVEKLTGIDFFPLLEDAEENELEGSFNVKLWDLTEFNMNNNKEVVAKRYGYDMENATYSETAPVSEVKPEGLWQTIQYFLYTNLGSYKRKVVDFFSDLFIVENKP